MVVVLFHFDIFGFSGGYIGVDIFFVISGYLMTSIIVRGGNDFSLLYFYQARVLRIVPALAVLLTVLIALGFLFLEPGSYKSLATQAGTAAVFISNFFFIFQSGYFAPGAKSQWLLHTWTLSVEWQFYLVFPLVFIVVRKINLSQAWLIALFVLAFTLSLVTAVILAHMQSRFAIVGFFLLLSRAFELLAGTLVFFLAPSKITRSCQPIGRRLLEIIGLAACLLSVGVFDQNTPWPSYNALLPVFGACCIILANRGTESLLSGRLFQFVGQWSYSIYLWHWPIIVLLQEMGVGHDPVWTIIGIIASVVIGALSYYWVETPARSRHGMDGRRLALRAVGVGTIAILGCCGAIRLAGGLPMRAKGDQALLSDAIAASGEREFPRDCKGIIDGEVKSCPKVSRPGRIAVLGDSHAMVWFPRYGHERNGITEFFVQPSCPPIPNFLDKTSISCTRFNDLVLQRVLNGPYKRIVFISIWVPYFDGFAAKFCHITSSGCRPLDGAGEEDRLFDDFYAAVRRLVVAGRDVVIVLPVPAPHFDLPKALRNQEFFGRTANRVRALDLGKVAAAEDRIRLKLRRASAYGARVVDPREFMCQGGQCPLISEDGRALYSDGNHLRPWVVRERLNFLDPFIRDESPLVTAAH